MSINIISIVSIIIWILLITELIKPSKEQNGRKIVTLVTRWFRINTYFDGFIYSKYPVLELIVI